MRKLSAIAVLVLTLAASALAQRVIPGSQAFNNASRLTHDIRWHTSLADVEAEARQQGKLVFWMHMLGNINGET